jgi:hypothetical protein
MANGDDQRSEESPTPSTRLAVSISPTTKAAIDRLVEREGITQTEAVRRLIGYGDMVYRLTQIDGEELLVRHGDSFDRIVVI